MSNIHVLGAMFVHYIEEEEECVGMEYEGKYEMHTIKKRREKEEEKLQYCLQQCCKILFKI